MGAWLRPESSEMGGELWKAQRNQARSLPFICPCHLRSTLYFRKPLSLLLDPRYLLRGRQAGTVPISQRRKRRPTGPYGLDITGGFYWLHGGTGVLGGRAEEHGNGEAGTQAWLPGNRKATTKHGHRPLARQRRKQEPRAGLWSRAHLPSGSLSAPAPPPGRRSTHQ